MNGRLVDEPCPVCDVTEAVSCPACNATGAMRIRLAATPADRSPQPSRKALP